MAAIRVAEIENERKDGGSTAENDYTVWIELGYPLLDYSSVSIIKNKGQVNNQR